LSCVSDPGGGVARFDHLIQNWDGGYDSYLEYLIKYGRLTNFADPLWATTWTNAVNSSIEHLVKQSTGGQYFLTSYDSTDGSSYSGGDLMCFAGKCLV
jgi:mannosyl-oligosaccharide alpha-1,2-mannosidase